MLMLEYTVKTLENRYFIPKTVNYRLFFKVIIKQNEICTILYKHTLLKYKTVQHTLYFMSDDDFEIESKI